MRQIVRIYPHTSLSLALYIAPIESKFYIKTSSTFILEKREPTWKNHSAEERFLRKILLNFELLRYTSRVHLLIFFINQKNYLGLKIWHTLDISNHLRNYILLHFIVFLKKKQIMKVFGLCCDFLITNKPCWIYLSGRWQQKYTFDR